MSAVVLEPFLRTAGSPSASSSSAPSGGSGTLTTSQAAVGGSVSGPGAGAGPGAASVEDQEEGAGAVDVEEDQEEEDVARQRSLHGFCMAVRHLVSMAGLAMCLLRRAGQLPKGGKRGPREAQCCGL